MRVEPPLSIVTVPLLPCDTLANVSVSPSGSLSLARTLAMTAALTVVVAVSSFASGGSLRGLTMMLTVAGSESAVPSLTT